jgi:lysozyme family protein
MSADFPTAFDWMITNEDPARAYKTVPDAPPGAFAISGINSHAFPVQFEAINAIPQTERGPAVQSFYLTEFWNQWYAQLATNDVAKRVFDEAVNGGAGTAVRILQASINKLAGGPVVVDGGWGPATVSAANSCNQTSLTTAFIQLRCAHYRSIAAANPNLAQYLPEWLERAEK